MSKTNIRHCILVILILLIGLFFLIRHILLYSSLLAFRLENISSSVPVKLLPIRLIDNGLILPFLDEPLLVRLYLDIVRDTVCGLTLRTQEQSVGRTFEAKKAPLNIQLRIPGEDWPSIGITMIGQKRLVNIEWAIRFVIANNVSGDFIECGVWRGGGSIFARAVFKALGVTDRHVWLADSFQGLPPARTSNDNNEWSQQSYLRVSLEEVQTNFRSFYLLDDQVHFCKGYFVDSLPRCNVSQIAVLRMDGDMYESTMDQLFNLYGKLSVGGVVIVDDYTIPACNRAIHDFRNWHHITDEIKYIPGDNAGRYWIKKHMIKIEMHLYQPLLVTTEKNKL